jgi:hypothetical protein
MNADRDEVHTIRIKKTESTPRSGPLSDAERARRYRARKKRGEDKVPKERPGPKRYEPKPGPPSPGTRGFTPAPRGRAPSPPQTAMDGLRRSKLGMATRALRETLQHLGRIRPADVDDALAELLGDVVAAAEELRTRNERSRSS